MTSPIDPATRVLLIHATGVVFDGLTASIHDVRDFLAGRSVALDRTDRDLLMDLNDALSVALDRTVQWNAFLPDRVNAALTRTAAIQPGRLRTTRTIAVHTMRGAYIPDIPTRGRLAAIMDNAADGARPVRARAIRLFMELTRLQPYGDGNKRTALFMANRMLADYGDVMPLMPPLDHTRFDQALSAWLADGDETLLRPTVWRWDDRADR